MRIYGKSLTEVTEADLQQLVSDGQEENLRLEFKVDCYDFTDETSKQEKRREFCKDALALANASGGWIICGLAETAGKAGRVVGLEKFNSDAQKRLFGQWLDNDAQPRVGQLNTHTVSLSDGKSVFIIEISRSFAAPHRNKQTNEFPLRREGRVEPNMTIDDLRRAFVGGATYADQIRAFRRERVDAILDPANPKSLIPIDDGPAFMVHLLPIGMVENPYRFSFTSLDFANKALWPTPHGHNFTNRAMFNFDGVIMPIRRDQSPAMEYIQVFRSGAIEYVETLSGYFRKPDEPLSFHAFESRILYSLVYAIRLQRSLNLHEPCFVGITIAKTEALAWKSDHRDALSETALPIKYERLLLPEQYVESWEQPLTAILKPTFDVWANALGWPSSYSYDQNGAWLRPDTLKLPSIN